MPTHIDNAQQLQNAMLEKRRKIIEDIVHRGNDMTDTFRRLLVIDDTIARAREIKGDERQRHQDEEYGRHEEAGTLIDDEFGSKTVPPAA